MPAPTNFTATVSAARAIEARVKVNDRLPRGFFITGRATLRSEKHQLWDVEVVNDGGDVNACWTLLTSYGISPSKALGSKWANVPGIGTVTA